jgi:FkbM family methyltransferase
MLAETTGETGVGGYGSPAWQNRMLGRLMRAIEYVRAFGIARGAINLALIRSSQEVVVLTVPGMRFPVFIRPNATDVFSFEEAFIRHLHDLDIDLDPKLIVDCGANVGYVSILFANAYPLSRVIAVEPEDSNIAILRLNADPYRNIDVVPAALWSTEGWVHIANPTGEKDAFQIRADTGGPIESVTIESIMRTAGADRIDILKLDIEGAELEIFSRPCDWLSKVAILLIELHDRAVPGCSFAFYSALARHDFVEIKRGITYAFLNRALLPASAARYSAPE